MLLLPVDPASPTPLYRQILAALRERIASGAVASGEELPSTRRLAEQLSVHRSTVAVAYQELWSLGYLDLQPGRCPRVRERVPLVAPAEGFEATAIDWQAASSRSANEILDAFRDRRDQTASTGDPSVIAFRSLDMDQRLLPVEAFRASLRKVVAGEGASLLGYGDPAGYRPLRELLSQRLRRHGIAAAPDELLLTSGSQQGIDLVLRLLAAPGRSIVLEAPTYDFALPLSRFWGFELVEIPLLADGLDLQALEQAVERHSPALVYTMPSFHNPSGICTTQAHREALLALCERHRLPMLEDGYDEEMKYSGRVVLPIKSMDRRQLVLYCGTFSKVLFPGVRIGWVAAHRECIERLTALRFFSEVAPSTVLQAALWQLCRDGAFDRHVSRMHRVFRNRMRAALQGLRGSIDPAWAEWAEPRGGYLIWLRLSFVPAAGEDVDAVLAAHGVSAAPGRSFFGSGAHGTHLRLSISTLSEEEIIEGIRRLARALEELYSRRKR